MELHSAGARVTWTYTRGELGPTLGTDAWRGAQAFTGDAWRRSGLHWEEHSETNPGPALGPGCWGLDRHFRTWSLQAEKLLGGQNCYLAMERFRSHH
jgi:hypothetical protein